MKLRLSSTSHSAKGRRERNEDSMFASDERGLYIVADGVGGMLHGEVASGVAVQEAVLASRTDVTVAGWTKRMVRVASEAVRAQTDRMGTTLTCAAFDLDNAMMHVGHAGDSRLYLLRRNDLRCITKDQTHHGALTGGLFTKSDAANAKPPQLTKLFVGKGDVVMLCTDGVHGSPWHGGIVPESVIYQAMKHEDVEWLVTTAISEWHSADNATAIIVRVS